MTLSSGQESFVSPSLDWLYRMLPVRNGFIWCSRCLERTVSFGERHGGKRWSRQEASSEELGVSILTQEGKKERRLSELIWEPNICRGSVGLKNVWLSRYFLADGCYQLLCSALLSGPCFRGFAKYPRKSWQLNARSFVFRDEGNVLLWETSCKSIVQTVSHQGIRRHLFGHHFHFLWCLLITIKRNWELCGGETPNTLLHQTIWLALGFL